MSWIEIIMLVGLAYIVYAYQPGGANLIPLSALALAIQEHEGWYPGSRSYRNNNPGNLRFMGQTGAIGVDSGGFAIFGNYESGFSALERQIKLDRSRNPQWTISEFISSYAPPVENDDLSYVDSIVQRLTSQGYTASANTTLGSFE